MEVKVLKLAKKTVTESIVATVEIDFPTENKFYKMNDEGRFFARGIVLFAITTRYSTSCQLFEVERNTQRSTDFYPKKDCNQESFLKDGGLRRTAFEIMTGEHYEYVEIQEDEFLTIRDGLLNDTLNEQLSKSED